MKLAKQTSAELVQISKIEKAIEEATTVGELMDLADQAEAFRVCAKKAGLGHDAECLGWQAKALAVRKGGEMLATMDRKTEPGPRSLHDETISWDDMGMSRIEGHRWQKFAGQSTDAKVRKFAAFCRDVPDGELPDRHHEPGTPEFIRWMYPPVEDLPAPPPPEGEYRCIVVDPPWPMLKITLDKDASQGPGHLGYQSMSVEEITAMKMPAAEDSHLYLWTTHRFLPDAFDIVEAWGFKYECLMTWVKNSGFAPFSWKYSTEHILFCRRGSLDVLAIGKRLDFAAKNEGHSRKPDLFYEKVAEVSPGPRIDMFARGPRVGFELWGAQA